MSPEELHTDVTAVCCSYHGLFVYLLAQNVTSSDGGNQAGSKAEANWALQPECTACHCSLVVSY